MTDRSIVVRLRGDVSDLQAKMKSGAQSVKGVSDAAEAASKKSGNAFGKIGDGLAKGLDKVEKNSAHINTLGNGFLTLGVAAAAGVGVAVKKFATFDQAMSDVAASGEDARANLAALRDAAVDAGAQTALSATEAAGGIEALAKAGVSAQDVLGGGLKGSLDLAAAGSIGVSEAAETAATAMTQFNLSGKDVPHIADLLAAAAGKAQGEVSDFAGALNQSGLVASQFGISIEETTGTLAAFASAGLLGSDAGTSFKTMLLRLANPSQEAAATMKSLGINAYDAQGQFVGIQSLAGQLQESMSGLSQAQRDAALSTIFGSDAIRAANVLYQQGGKGIADWTSQVDDAGFAAETAATKLDNLKGDLEGFTGALETAFIGSGSGANDFLRSLTQGATDLVNTFNDLPAGVQQGTLAVGATVAVTALAVGGLAKLAVAAAETRAAFLALGVSGGKIKAGLSGMGPVAAGVAAGYAAATIAMSKMNDQLDENSAGIDGYAKGLGSLVSGGDLLDSQMAKWGSSFALWGQGITDTKTAFESLKGVQNPLAQGFKGLAELLPGLSSSAGTVEAEFDKLDQALTQLGTDDAAAAFRKLSDEATAAGFTIEDQTKIFDDYKAKLADQAAQLGVNSLSAQDYVDWMGGKVPAAITAAAAKNPQLADSMSDVADAAAKQQDALAAAITALDAMSSAQGRTLEDSQNLAGSLFTQGDAYQSAIAAQAAFAEAGDEAGKVLARNGETLTKSGKALSVNSEKGRENIGVLNNLAASGKAYVSALVAQGAGADEAAKATKKVRAEFVEAAKDAGLSSKAAAKLADDYGLVPSEVSTQINLFGQALAETQVQEFRTALQDLPAEQRAKILATWEREGADAAKAELEELQGKTFTAQVVVAGGKVSAQEAKDINAALEGIPAEKRAEIKTIAETKGAKAAYEAMARVVSKQVTAATKGDPKGARQVKSEMDKLRDKLVRALSRGDISGARKVIGAMQKVRDKTVTARVKADTSGATRAKQSIENIRDKTVYIRIKEQKMKAAGGPVYRSNGGPVWGAGTETSDSIDAKLSDGEFVQRAAATKYYGVGFMTALNQMAIPKERLGLAAGGLVGYATGGPVLTAPTPGVDFAAIWRLVAAVTRPLQAVVTAQAAVAKENREVAAARRAVANAKGKKAKSKAKSNLDKQVGELKDATKNLKDAQQAVADQARSRSASYADPYRSKSTDIDDWLESMREGATDLAAFQQDLAAMRKLGVSETIVQQIADQGAIVGHELAQQILDGGSSIAKSLNTANSNLQKVADAIGYDTVTVTGRYATGGLVGGVGTGTSDSNLIAASRGEWIVPEKAVASNIHLLRHMTYGPQTYVPVHAYGGAGRQTVSKTWRAGDVTVHATGDPDAVARKIATRQADAMRALMSRAL